MLSICEGEGIDDFFVAVNDAAKEYEQEYLPELRKRMAEQQASRAETSTTPEVSKEEVKAAADPPVPPSTSK